MLLLQPVCDITASHRYITFSNDGCCDTKTDRRALHVCSCFSAGGVKGMCVFLNTYTGAGVVVQRVEARSWRRLYDFSWFFNRVFMSPGSGNKMM